MSCTDTASTASDQPSKRGKWSPEEDAALRKGVELFGDKQWKSVAQLVEGRLPIQCMHRWSDILKPGIRKGPWDENEDNLLRAWVEAKGPCKWSECAATIASRTGKQCRERWSNALAAGIKLGEWSLEEDRLLFEMYFTVGAKWTDIARKLPGRTENSIKNRFYSLHRQKKDVSFTDFFLAPHSLLQEALKS
jgi:hypothetical protein